jgi:hypothetical protein
MSTPKWSDKHYNEDKGNEIVEPTGVDELFCAICGPIDKKEGGASCHGGEIKDFQNNSDILSGIYWKN